MDGDVDGFLGRLKKCFADLQDRRIAKSCDDLRIDIVRIAVLALACGADAWTGVETFTRFRYDWLKTFLQLPGGLPSHDTFRRVFGLLDRKQFAVYLFRSAQALQEATAGRLIAITGRTLRRSFAQRIWLKALNLLTARASENGFSLGELAFEEKSNEIAAIPARLPFRNLKGCTVTIDAMGCQTELVEQIRDQREYYVNALKERQLGLHDTLWQFYGATNDQNFPDLKHEAYATSETAYGRTTERTCLTAEDPCTHPQCKGCRDASTLVVTTKRVLGYENDALGLRPYVTDLGPRAKPPGTAVRKCWGIKNGQQVMRWTVRSARTRHANKIGTVPPIWPRCAVSPSARFAKRYVQTRHQMIMHGVRLLGVLRAACALD